MIVYFSITLMVLLGFVGMAVDIGRMELATTQLQSVADDTALTAATEFQNGNNSWATVGSKEAAAIGAANGLSAVTASFQEGANSGPYVGNNSAIQATVSQTLSLYFLPFVTGGHTTTLSALAVAQVAPCSYFNSGNPYSFSVTAAHPVDSPCPVYAEGAVYVDPTAIWNDLQIRVTGASYSSLLLGSMENAPSFLQPTVSDPLSYITPPVFQACTPGYKNLTITSPTTLNPGTYCGGLTIVNTTVSLQPGLYIITGGFSLGLGSTFNGTGVTLYFTQGGGSGFGTIAFGNRTAQILTYVNLTAPTDSSNGGIPSILLYVDPAWTGTDPLSIVNCVWTGGGVVYSQSTGVSLYASVIRNVSYFVMDVNYLSDEIAPLHLFNDFSSLATGNPFRVPAVLVQ